MCSTRSPRAGPKAGAQRGWVKADKKPALNPDLWQTLLELTERHTMHYHWVKGHADNPKNNRCDQMAVAAANGRDLLVDTGYEEARQEG